jgi:hypothetical protein
MVCLSESLERFRQRLATGGCELKLPSVKLVFWMNGFVLDVAEFDQATLREKLNSSRTTDIEMVLDDVAELGLAMLRVNEVVSSI